MGEGGGLGGGFGGGKGGFGGGGGLGGVLGLVPEPPWVLARVTSRARLSHVKSVLWAMVAILWGQGSACSACDSMHGGRAVSNELPPRKGVNCAASFNRHIITIAHVGDVMNDVQSSH